MNRARRQSTVSSAARVRVHRERHKRGVRMLTIEVPSGLPDALCEVGLLEEWNCENPSEIRKAIERVLAQLLA